MNAPFCDVTHKCGTPTVTPLVTKQVPASFSHDALRFFVVNIDMTPHPADLIFRSEEK